VLERHFKLADDLEVAIELERSCVAGGRCASRSGIPSPLTRKGWNRPGVLRIACSASNCLLAPLEFSTSKCVYLTDDGTAEDRRRYVSAVTVRITVQTM